MYETELKQCTYMTQKHYNYLQRSTVRRKNSINTLPVAANNVANYRLYTTLYKMF